MCFYFLTISSLFLCIVFFTKHIVSKHIYIRIYNERVFYVSGEMVLRLSFWCGFIFMCVMVWCVTLLFLGGIPEQNPCFTGRHGCDTNAVCRPAQGKEFSCECAAGFTGDGRVCYGNMFLWCLYFASVFVFKHLRRVTEELDKSSCSLVVEVIF